LRPQVRVAERGKVAMDSMDQKSKYLRVRHDILRKIETAQWRPGDRLPAETELAKLTDVSLGTVQRALRILEQEGVVVRRHGSGTYVTSIIPTPSEIYNHFFVADDKFDERVDPLPLYIKVLDLTTTSKPGPWSRFLNTSGPIIRVSRMISVNLEFQVYTELFLRKAEFQRLLQVPKHQLDGVALLRMMYSGNQLPPRRFVYEMRLGIPPARALPHIQSGPDVSCIHWETLAYDHHNDPLFYSVAFVPPSARRLRIEVLRVPNIDKSQYSAESGRAAAANRRRA
jgi:GntR family transcriptional regulator